MMTLYTRNLDGKPVSTYEYIVMVNAEKIAEGKVKHRRTDGWAILVSKIGALNLDSRALEENNG